MMEIIEFSKVRNVFHVCLCVQEALTRALTCCSHSVVCSHLRDFTMARKLLWLEAQP